MASKWGHLDQGHAFQLHAVLVRCAHGLFTPRAQTGVTAVGVLSVGSFPSLTLSVSLGCCHSWSRRQPFSRPSFSLSSILPIHVLSPMSDGDVFFPRVIVTLSAAHGCLAGLIPSAVLRWDPLALSPVNNGRSLCLRGECRQGLLVARRRQEPYACSLL